MEYKMPTKSTLRSRSSTISNAFAISVTPFIKPSDVEISNSLKLLEVNENQCAYCLREGLSKDHLKPLVKKGMPTGYITSIQNLVHVVQIAIHLKVQSHLRIGICQVIMLND